MKFEEWFKRMYLGKERSTYRISPWRMYSARRNDLPLDGRPTLRNTSIEAQICQRADSVLEF